MKFLSRIIPAALPLLYATALAAQTEKPAPPPAPAPAPAPVQPAPKPAPDSSRPAPAPQTAPAPTTPPVPTQPAQMPPPVAPAQTAIHAQATRHAAPGRTTLPSVAPVTRLDGCTIRDITKLGRNPTPAELRCRYGVKGPGRFGLLSYLDVPVYQPRTPQPGTHVVGVPGMPRPRPRETYEEWEWRVLRTHYGPEVRNVHRGLEMADPVFASKLLRLERLLRERGVRASRRETFRSAERQAFIFQQGRSRAGPIATTTLTSWHNRVDRLGRAAARAADYDVSPGQLPRFHALADSVGLLTYGADSNDPGHVYLPDTDAATGMELAVLRLVPQVPYVTLETGRPVDEAPIPGMPDHWRELTAEFIARPRPFPKLDPITPPLPALREPPPPPPPPPPPAPEPRRRGRGRRP